MIRSVIPMALLVALGAAQPSLAQSRTQLEGFDGVTFGTSFDNAKTALGSSVTPDTDSERHLMLRIERLVEGPYIELFARETKKGWDCWGNQTGLFDKGSTRTRRQPSSPTSIAEELALGTAAE